MIWGSIKNTKKTLVSQSLLLIGLVLALSSCQGQKTFKQAHLEELNQVPTEMEAPESPDDNTIDPTLNTLPGNELPNEGSVESSNEDISSDTHAPEDDQADIGPDVPVAPQHKPFKPRPSTKPAPSTSPNKPVVLSNDVLAPTPDGPSKFIQIAAWVINNEKRKIGTACNFYVSRVLELAGYSDDSFLANDFDIYARRNFSSTQTSVFDTNNVTPERARLKKHLWSYPERTPFILNWERSQGMHGHIAIVERIGDQLVIFQASMNKHMAQRQQTTIENILSYSRKAKLSVYAQFRP